MESDVIEEDLKNWFSSYAHDPSSELALQTLFENTSKGDLYIDWQEPVSAGLPIVHKNSKLYFEATYLKEKQLAKLYNEISQSKPELKLDTPLLNHYPLEDAQKAAIQLAFQNRLTLITGGPGTGKTYTAGVLISELLRAKPHLKIALAAPTGKAAGRLKESLERVIKGADLTPFTLHRLLQTWYDEQDLLPYDFILVDESSMIDLKLMVRLFEALMPGARLVLMGDPYQLPPVDAGSVFADLAEKAPKAHLTKCLRAELQEIVDFSKLILEKDCKAVLQFLRNSPLALKWEETDEISFKVTEKMLLTPLRKGPFGTEALNKIALSEGPKAPYPIMITRNHDGLGLYNGDMGTISSLLQQPGEKAQFGDRIFPSLVLPSFELAFALSIHKCQGSEFNDLRVLFPEGSETFGNASLYTAVTRAKRFCTVTSTEDTLKKIIETNSRRRSNLVNLI